MIKGNKEFNLKETSVGPFYPIFWGKMDLLGKKLFIQACVWPNLIMLHILDFFENSEEVGKNASKYSKNLRRKMEFYQK